MKSFSRSLWRASARVCSYIQLLTHNAGTFPFDSFITAEVSLFIYTFYAVWSPVVSFIFRFCNHHEPINWLFYCYCLVTNERTKRWTVTPVSKSTNFDNALFIWWPRGIIIIIIIFVSWIACALLSVHVLGVRSIRFYGSFVTLDAGAGHKGSTYDTQTNKNRKKTNKFTESLPSDDTQRIRIHYVWNSTLLIHLFSFSNLCCLFDPHEKITS